MITLSVREEFGTVQTVQVALNDFVAQLKGVCHGLFPYTAGKLLEIRYGGILLEDSACIGDYAFKRKDCVVDLSVAMRQPFSKVNYSKVVNGFVREGRQKSVSDYYIPGRKESWDGKWTKGDEYLMYPPVDVNNPWSSIAPSTSRELTCSSPVGEGLGNDRRINKKSNRRRAITAFSSLGWDAEYENPETKKEESGKSHRERRFSDLEEKINSNSEARGRSFHSLYVCNVMSFTFSTIHKMEGKWSGMVLHTGFKSDAFSPVHHACSSRLRFDSDNRAWEEIQTYTNSDGISSSRVLRYKPISSGILSVETDDPKFMEETIIRVQETDANVMILTAINHSTGQVVVTETITCSVDFQHRVRTVQRFTPFGELYDDSGVMICKERKILDAETGALDRQFP
mmetsp:Transcript_3943/g.4820  ORF Transcript_3943/g.4820 Transcript_3943/m.4820 type:complete len:399 (+) Transcript_3943:151-1347(+)